MVACMFGAHASLKAASQPACTTRTHASQHSGQAPLTPAQRLDSRQAKDASTTGRAEDVKCCSEQGSCRT